MTLLFSGLSLNAQNWKWATSFPLNFQNRLARDDDGNAYISGNFNGAISLGPFTLNSINPASYLAKIDSNGNFVWVRKVEMSIQKIAVGNSKIYLAGNFSGTSDFGGTLITAIGTDVILAAYDFDGFFQFEKHGTSVGDDTFHSIFINNAGTIYVSGKTENTIIFEGNVINPGGFVIILDGNGNVIRTINVSPNITAREVQIDASDNIYVLCDYTGTITIGGAQHVADPEFGSHFIASFTSIGGFRWYNELGINYYYTTKNLTVTKNGDFYLSRDERYTEIVISKYTSLGALKWKKKFGGSAYDFCNDLTLDTNENLYLSGNFFHKGNFGGINVEGEVHSLMFLVKLDSSGAGLWAKIGKKLTDGVKIAFLSRDRGFLVGTAENSFIDNLPVNGSFIARLQPGKIFAGKTFTKDNDIELYPNPTTGMVTLDFSNIKKQKNVIIYDETGQVVFEKTYSSSEDLVSIDLKNLPKGIYSVEIISDQNKIVKKLIRN